MTGTLKVETVVSAPFGENSYVVWGDASPDCFIVDPGFEPDPIREIVRRNQLVVRAILNTHGHVDHIAGNQAMKDAYPEAPLMIGAGEVDFLTDPSKNLSFLMGMQITSPPADRVLREGEGLDLLGQRWSILEIPGHSPGHLLFLGVSGKVPVVFGGDVLFAGSIGRTDFPGGSFKTLAEGIRSKLYPLPDATTVFPGHGPATTIGEEKRSNPFVPAEGQ